jgi:hypothetical protein
MYLIKKQKPLIKISSVKTEYEQSVARLQAMVRGFLVRRSNHRASTASLTIQAYWRMWYERTRFKRRLRQYRNQQIQISYFFKQIELFSTHSNEQLKHLKEVDEYSNQSSIDSERKSIPKIVKPLKSLNTKRRVAILCEYYDKIHAEFLSKKKKKIVEEPKKEILINTVTRRPSTAPPITNIPQAPPCPPPEFFKQTSAEVRPFKRLRSAPATVTTPIDELKQLFAK